MRRLIPLVLLAAGLPSLALSQENPPKPDDKPPAKAEGKGKTVGEVVVTGQVAPVQTSIDRKSYSVAGDLQAQTGAVADVLRNVPAVEVDVQGNVSLRGDPNVTILVDGKPSSLFEGDNKAQALQSMPADSIERVEVITNPSAEFGANGSGVINLITKKSRGAGASGSLSFSQGDDHRGAAGLTGGYNSPKLNLTGELNARQDTLKVVTADDRFERPTVAAPFQQVDQHQIQDLLLDSIAGRGGADYDLTDRTRIGAEAHFNYSFFRSANPTSFTQADMTGALQDSFQRLLSTQQKRAAGQVGINLRQKLGPDGEFSASLSGEEVDDPRVRFGHDFDLAPMAADTFDEQRLNYHQHHHELKADLTQPLGQAGKLKAGVDLDYTDNSYRNRGFAGPSEAALAPDAALTNLFEFRRTVSAAYVTYEKSFGPLSVLGGLRGEDVRVRLDQVTLGQADENDYAGIYPSLHLGWKLSDDQTLTASYSQRVYRPDPLQYNAFRLELDPLDFQAGNPRLKPQQSYAIELGYEQHLGGTLFATTLFFRENRDGVLPVVTDLGNGVSLSQPLNEGRIVYPGLEVTASGKLTSTLSYNIEAMVTWKRLDTAPGPEFAPSRSLLSESSHGSVTWQATANDLFQLNYFSYQKGLTPQGTLSPVMGFDLGYRRKLANKLFLLVTLQDFLHSYHALQVNDTPLLIEKSKTDFDTTSLRVSLTWSFGRGKPKDPTFEFEGGGAGPTP